MEQEQNQEAIPGAPGKNPEGSGGAALDENLEPSVENLEGTGGAALSQQPKPSAEMRSADPFFSGRKHFPELDGLRGVAILLVMASHYSWLVVAPDRILAIARAIASQGWIGVNLFFALSGFLITGILLDSKGRPRYLLTFYARRVLRIFPLFYGVLIAALAAVLLVKLAIPRFYASDRDAHGLYAAMPWLWTYTVNIGMAWWHVNPWLLGHFWSLAVEEQFYLFWPLVVLVSSRRRLFFLCMWLAVAALACRLVITGLGFPYGVNYLFTPCQIDPIALGAAAAIVYRKRELAPLVGGRIALAARVLLSIGLLLLLLGPVSGLFSLAVSREIINYGNGAAVGALTVGENPWFLDIAGTGIAVACAFLVLHLALPGRDLLSRLFGFRPLRILGGYAYGLYVFHFPVLEISKAIVYRWRWASAAIHSGFLPSLAFVGINGAVSFLLAYTSYHLYEKHFLKLKKYFPERVAAAGVPPQ